MNRRRSLLGPAGVLTITLVVAACGSSSKPAATSPTSSSQSTSVSASASAAPIKVGVICSCAGPFGAPLVGIEDVYKAWANTVNASGGIVGHPVQLITEDDESTPGNADADIHTLIADHVVAIADMSQVDQVWASTIQAANIPVVGVTTTNAPFWTNSDFYPEGQTGDSIFYGTMAVAKAAGASSVGYAYCAEAPSCAEGFPLAKAAGQKVGVPVTYGASIAAASPNFTAQCLAAKQDHVATLWIEDGEPVVARMASDCDQQGYTPTYIMNGAAFGSDVLTATGLKTDLLSDFADLPYIENTSAVDAMTTAVNKYYPGLIENGNVWNQDSSASWVSGLLLEDAVKAGGLGSNDTPSAAEIVKGLDSLKGDTLDGWSPPLTFAAGQPHPVDCWYTLHIQNGVPSLANGGKVSCENGSTS